MQTEKSNQSENWGFFNPQLPESLTKVPFKEFLDKFFAYDDAVGHSQHLWLSIKGAVGNPEGEPELDSHDRQYLLNWYSYMLSAIEQLKREHMGIQQSEYYRNTEPIGKIPNGSTWVLVDAMFELVSPTESKSIPAYEWSDVFEQISEEQESGTPINCRNTESIGTIPKQSLWQLHRGIYTLVDDDEHKTLVAQEWEECFVAE